MKQGSCFSWCKMASYLKYLITKIKLILLATWFGHAKIQELVWAASLFTIDTFLS